ncbi:holin [Streptomyces sp. NPDC048644]|uniref:holin n=1 Tax=Streptomyces sp. NPDC048644 TaxID=3365582 RepID=UPI00371EA7F1
MTELAFWGATFERIVRTFAQALLAILGANEVGILDAPWVDALSTAGMAAVLALLTAVATSGTGTGGGPGITETVRGPRTAVRE